MKWLQRALCTRARFNAAIALCAFALTLLNGYRYLNGDTAGTGWSILGWALVAATSTVVGIGVIGDTRPPTGYTILRFIMGIAAGVIALVTLFSVWTVIHRLDLREHWPALLHGTLITVFLGLYAWGTQSPKVLQEAENAVSR